MNYDTNQLWQPIENAPKDKTPVDLWSPIHGRLPHYRRIERTQTNVFYDPIHTGIVCVRDATHFMPIPFAPSQETVNATWQPCETAPKTRTILADVGYPWPLACLWDAEAGKWAVAFLNVETKNDETKESRNVWWETEYEVNIMRWMEVPKL